MNGGDNHDNDNDDDDVDDDNNAPCTIFCRTYGTEFPRRGSGDDDDDDVNA